MHPGLVNHLGPYRPDKTSLFGKFHDILKRVIYQRRCGDENNISDPQNLFIFMCGMNNNIPGTMGDTLVDNHGFKSLFRTYISHMQLTAPAAEIPHFASISYNGDYVFFGDQPGNVSGSAGQVYPRVIQHWARNPRFLTR